MHGVKKKDAEYEDYAQPVKIVQPHGLAAGAFRGGVDLSRVCQSHFSPSDLRRIASPHPPRAMSNIPLISPMPLIKLGLRAGAEPCAAAMSLMYQPVRFQVTRRQPTMTQHILRARAHAQRSWRSPAGPDSTVKEHMSLSQPALI
jgi:hypothetical protein